MTDLSGGIALVLMACLAGYGAWTDITRRHLSNWLSLATLVAGLGYAAFIATPELFLLHLAHFAVALGIGLALFATGVWGGGDGKFYAAVAAWFPVGAFFNLVLSISMVGLVMMTIMIATSRGRLLRKDSKGVPYGVAIGIGAFLALGQRLW